MHGVLGTVCSVLRYARRAVVQTSIAFRQAAELVVEWAAEGRCRGLRTGLHREGTGMGQGGGGAHEHDHNHDHDHSHNIGNGSSGAAEGESI